MPLTGMCQSEPESSLAGWFYTYTSITARFNLYTLSQLKWAVDFWKLCNLLLDDDCGWFWCFLLLSHDTAAGGRTGSKTKCPKCYKQWVESFVYQWLIHPLNQMCTLYRFCCLHSWHDNYISDSVKNDNARLKIRWYVKSKQKSWVFFTVCGLCVPMLVMLTWYEAKIAAAKFKEMPDAQELILTPAFANLFLVIVSLWCALSLMGLVAATVNNKAVLNMYA